MKLPNDFFDPYLPIRILSNPVDGFRAIPLKDDLDQFLCEEKALTLLDYLSWEELLKNGQQKSNWSNPESNGIHEIVDDVISIIHNSGGSPDVVAMSTPLFKKLQSQNKSQKICRHSPTGSGSLDTINDWMDRHGYPRIFLYNQLYTHFSNDGQMTRKCYLPRNRYCLLSRGVGERLVWKGKNAKTLLPEIQVGVTIPMLTSIASGIVDL